MRFTILDISDCFKNSNSRLFFSTMASYPTILVDGVGEYSFPSRLVALSEA